MPQYYGVVRKDPDSAFAVEFPDFPGCVSAADAFEAVRPNAVEALELYLDDGRDLPPPLQLEEVGKRYADDLAAGAFLLPVRLPGREKPVRRSSHSLERGVLRAIDEAATLRRLSLCLFGARDQR
jgi:predicted RNase H-like HicB family nuclease